MKKLILFITIFYSSLFSINALADGHITAEAIENSNLDGERIIMATSPINMPQIGAHLKSNGWKVSTRALPNFVVKLMALFIKEARLVSRGLGTTNFYDCTNTIEKSGWASKSHEEMIVSAAKSLNLG